MCAAAGGHWRRKYNSLCIVTGKPSYIFVLDIDNKGSNESEHGLNTWNRLIEENGQINTWTARSPNGGLHIYFKYSERLEIFHTCANITIDGKTTSIDIRTDGGMIIAPPSNYLSNDNSRVKAYTWITSPYSDVELADMPDWLFDKLNIGANLKAAGKPRTTIQRISTDKIS